MKSVRFTIYCFFLVSFTISQFSCEKNDTVSNILKDIDNNTYKTIRIGNQVWMAENLRTTRYNDGESVTDYFYYNNDSLSNAETYGILYSPYTVGRGNICPVGWHVSTQNDWIELSDTLGGVDIAGSKLKEGGLDHWHSPNENTTNESGFTALPGGTIVRQPYWWNAERKWIYRDEFYGMGNVGFWWSDTTVCELSYQTPQLFLNHESNHLGLVFSIRCVKD